MLATKTIIKAKGIAKRPRSRPKSVPKEGNKILNYTSGLLKEPKKCVDADKKYDYSVEALPLYYLKKGDIFNLKANDVKGNMRIKSLALS